MTVEELVAKLGFRVRSVAEAQKFIKLLEQTRKASKDAGRDLSRGLTGRNMGLNRVASDAERAAKAIRRARLEAERLARVRIRPGGTGGFGPGYGYGGGPRRGHSGGRSDLGRLAEAGIAGAGLGMGRAAVAAATAYGTGRVAQTALKSSMDFERSMIDVTKATDATAAERAQYEKDILRMARDTGQNKEGLAGMLAEAGRSGRPKGDLVQFTRFGAMASTAWQTTPEATGQSLAEICNIYEASQKRIEEIADQINHAADSSASKEIDLLEITRRVGSTAKTASLMSGTALRLSSRDGFRSVLPRHKGPRSRSPRASRTAVNAMDNVIRPSFGGRQQPISAEPPAHKGGYQPLHVYGQAAGNLVALIEDASGPEGLVLKIVVGPAAGNSIEAVAFFVASDAGRIDADATANAILRALEVVEGGRAPGGTIRGRTAFGLFVNAVAVGLRTAGFANGDRSGQCRSHRGERRGAGRQALEGTGRTMNAAEIKDLTGARAALARQRNAIARKMAAIELAPVSMAEDLTRVLLAIEAVDRALADAGQPFMATEA